MIKNNAAIVKALCLHLTEKNAIIILFSYGQIHFRWYESLCFQLKLVWVLTIFNEGAYLAFKSIYKKAYNWFQFDCEIRLESVHGTNQYIKRNEGKVVILCVFSFYKGTILKLDVKQNYENKWIFLYIHIYKKIKKYKGGSWKWLNKRWEEHFITNMTSLFWWTGELGPLKCVLCYELISQIEFNSKKHFVD